MWGGVGSMAACRMTFVRISGGFGSLCGADSFFGQVTLLGFTCEVWVLACVLVRSGSCFVFRFVNVLFLWFYLYVVVLL